MSQARDRVLSQIFSIPEQRKYSVTARSGNTTKIYPIWAGSVEEAAVKGHMAGEVLQVGRMEA
jgi:hypothetical protein